MSIAVSGVYRSSFCILFLFVFDTGTHRPPLLCCEILVPVVNSSIDTTARKGRSKYMSCDIRQCVEGSLHYHQAGLWPTSTSERTTSQGLFSLIHTDTDGSR